MEEVNIDRKSFYEFLEFYNANRNKYEYESK